MGLYTIAVLTELEKILERPIATAFDLLAGTSVGGILALGLAAEHPAEEIKRSFEENGTRIFSNRPPPQNWLNEINDFFRAFKTSKYNNQELRRTIEGILGDKTLIGDLKHPVLVPTVNLTKSLSVNNLVHCFPVWFDLIWEGSDGETEDAKPSSGLGGVRRILAAGRTLAA